MHSCYFRLYTFVSAYFLFITCFSDGPNSTVLGFLTDATKHRAYFLLEESIRAHLDAPAPAPPAVPAPAPAPRRAEISAKGSLCLLDEYLETEVDDEGSKGLLADSNTAALAACALWRLADIKEKLPFNMTSKSPHKDILTWWKEYEPMFPLVAAVAKKVLSVPATSAPSERLFSTARRVSSGDRATLSPSMLEAVVRIHNNQRRNPKAVVAIRGSRSGVTV